MLWVLKRTVSMRRFFEHPKHMLKLMGKKIFTFLRQKLLFILTYGYAVIQLKLEYSLCSNRPYGE